MKTGRGFAAVALGVALLGSACGKEPTRWDSVATATLTGPAGPKIEGSKLNAFFPPDGTDGYARVFTQEKEGFVEAKMKKDGAEVATLAISDVAGDESLTSKFGMATEKVGDYTLVTVGKNQSSVLVKNRFQAKVSSQTLDPEARKALLAKFDLAGLSKL